MRKSAIQPESLPALLTYPTILDEQENRRRLALPLAIFLSAITFLLLPLNQQTLGESLVKRFLSNLPDNSLTAEPAYIPVTRVLPAKLSPDAPLANKIVYFMKRQGYQVFEGERRYNIVYIEGMNLDGVPNANEPNQFNDLRLVIEVIHGKPRIVNQWEATTEPGIYYTEYPQDYDGAFRVKPGQYTAWEVGYHWGNGWGTAHEGLIQVKPISGYRDGRKVYQREGKVYTGLYDISQHHGNDEPYDDIGYYGAGCLVGRSIIGHEEFMDIVKNDIRYEQNPAFLFTTTVILADSL